MSAFHRDPAHLFNDISLIPVLSIALVSRYDPSGDNSIPVTVSVCPLIFNTTAFLRRSHTCQSSKGCYTCCTHTHDLVLFKSQYIFIGLFQSISNELLLIGVVAMSVQKINLSLGCLQRWKRNTG